MEIKKLTEKHHGMGRPESPELDPAIQPVVTILWSESDRLREGEQMPLAKADLLFRELDAEQYDKPGYDKTQFSVAYTLNGELSTYVGRQDFGDGDGSMIAHIKAYHKRCAKDEHWKNDVLHYGGGPEAWEKAVAEHEMILNELVPYMQLHCSLAGMEQAAADALDMLSKIGEPDGVERANIAYHTAIQAYIAECRHKLNTAAGEYHLPECPQKEDFTDSVKDIGEAAEADRGTGPTYYAINETAARHAKEAISFSDYRPGSATAQYRHYVDEAAELAAQQKKYVDPMYHEKIDGLLDTYARKMAANMNKSYEIAGRVPSILIAGGSNFPVQKKEKQNAARDKNMEEYQEIQGLLDKIRSTGMGGISADDPQAVQKLQNKLANLEKSQETMKSNSAAIRRVKSRIQDLSQKKEIGFAGWKFAGGKVEANTEANRLQIIFDEKPEEVMRAELKSNGFRWSPRAGAWQRQLTDNAYFAANHVKAIRPLTGEKPTEIQRMHIQEAELAQTRKCREPEKQKARRRAGR